MNCGKKIQNMKIINKKVKQIEKNCSDIKINPVNRSGGTSLNDDPCYLSKKYAQSIGPGSYMLQSFKNNNTNTNVKEMVINNNILNVNDGCGIPTGNQCKVDIDSELRIKSGNVITNDKRVNQLFSRPFLTVPYMGRGSGNPCADTMLKPGEDTFQGKACNNKRDDPNFQPLVKCLKNNIQNPKHIITEDVKIDWVRGGIPSRQLVRDIEYKERCQK